MKDGLKVLVGRGLPDSLSKRERQVMADAKAFAKAADAFSVSFFATRRTTKAIVYLKQPEPKRLQQADLDLEEDDCEKDGDAGDAPAPAPASAGAKRGAQPPTKPPGSTSKHISNMAEGISTPSRPPGKLTHAKEATKARGVDKNALSARGSPEGERLSPAAPDDDPMGERDEGTSSKKPKAAFKSWQAPMQRAQNGPPPPVQLKKPGKWCSAYEAYLQYGDPKRKVWIRKSDGKIWEADGDDHVGRGDG